MMLQTQLTRPSHIYPTPGRVALVLAGGAARGAYEVGVVQHILEELPKDLGRNPPIDIFCGTSVGAINSAWLASHAHRPDMDIGGLVAEWEGLRLRKHLLERPPLAQRRAHPRHPPKISG